MRYIWNIKADLEAAGKEKCILISRRKIIENIMARNGLLKQYRATIVSDGDKLAVGEMFLSVRDLGDGDGVDLVCIAHGGHIKSRKLSFLSVSGPPH
ncbi:hypothetical protein [Paracoccus sp. KR1-242]|uniref:hypothetical protein n=1 Tax=Paracoccus sp. KR1-242 TaxID=3410028 RepID=UPI003C0A0756